MIDDTLLKQVGRIVVPVSRKSDGGYEAGVVYAIDLGGDRSFRGEFVMPITDPAGAASAIMNGESAFKRMFDNFFDPIKVARMNAGPPVPTPSPEPAPEVPKRGRPPKVQEPPPAVEPPKVEYVEVKEGDPLPPPVVPLPPVGAPKPLPRQPMSQQVVDEARNRATAPVPAKAPIERDGKKWRNHVVTFGKHAGRTLGVLADENPKRIEWYAIEMGGGSNDGLSEAQKETRYYAEHGMIELQPILEAEARKELEAEG